MSVILSNESDIYSGLTDDIEIWMYSTTFADSNKSKQYTLYQSLLFQMSFRKAVLLDILLQKGMTVAAYKVIDPYPVCC